MQLRYLLPLVLWIPSVAQPPAPSTASPDPEIVIPANVTEVVAPTIVRGTNRQLVQGVQLSDFELYDNNKLQQITADLADEPISLVVAIETSLYVDGILPKIEKLGLLLSDLVAGQNGEIAVIGFDHQTHLLQDFTSEGARVCSALKNIKPGSSNHVLLQAVAESVRMLQHRPANRHRVVLLIAERRDKGSPTHLREALTIAQEANVTVYALDISALVAFGSQKAVQRPPSIPTTAQHIPAGGALTPTTIHQNYYLGSYVPAFVDLFSGAYNSFVDDNLDMLTRFTGGKQYMIRTHASLENAIQSTSQEIHNQYLLSYVPNNQDESGFHEIKVVVKRPGVEAHTRTGYWLSAK